MIEVIPIQIGEIRTNSYLLVTGNECLLIDPGSDETNDIATIKKFIGEKKLLAVVYTHNHYDHIQGGYLFTDVPHYMHTEDIKTLTTTTKFYEDFRKIRITLSEHVEALSEKMTIGPFNFQVIHTPGHTKGGACLLFSDEKFIITGDTLFCGTCGRTDLPNGSTKEMKESLETLEKLDSELIVYPGHGKSSTIGIEKHSIQKLLEEL